MHRATIAVRFSYASGELLIKFMVMNAMIQEKRLIKRDDIRNVAIIAHVDHGKTTLVDGLLIDAVEGPMPQTRFVLQKALELNLQPIVVINKIDRRDARIDQVFEWTQDLFLELATTDAHLDFPILYAVGRDGVAMYHPNDERRDLGPLFETIINTVPAPVVDTEAPLQLLVAALDYDDYKDKQAIIRLVRGRVTPNTFVAHINRDGVVTRQKINLVLTYQGLQRVEVAEALAGHIVALTGIPDANIGDTIAYVETP